jgi:hypothetical protein
MEEYMASQRQQQLSDYLDAVHGRAFVGEHFSDDELVYDDEQPSSPPPAANAPAKASPAQPAQSPAKIQATKAQMEDAQKLLALALELSRKRKASAQLTKHPLPKDMV